MKDKSPGIWLIILFGVSGMALTTLAWLLPALQSDRLTATVAGSVGIMIASIQVVIMRQAPTASGKRVPVEITDES